MSLWAFAKRTWDHAPARRALLALQEEDDQCVPLLLWSLWASDESRVVDDGTLHVAARTALPWHLAAEELRSARARLKGAEAKPGVLAMIESTSVLAERDLLDRLEALTPSVQSLEPPDAIQQLVALTAAWQKPVSADRLEALRVALHAEQDGGFSDNDEDPDDVRRLRAELAELKAEHAEVSSAVEILESAPLPDQLQIARMKRRKLALRDEIVAVENQIMPDIIA